MKDGFYLSELGGCLYGWQIADDPSDHGGEVIKSDNKLVCIPRT